MTASLFLVECFWPGVTRQQVEAASARAQAQTGAAVRFLGALLVPSDEVVLFQFRAGSSDEVARAAREAKLPFDRVAESIWLGPSGA
ncbi:MAG: hypothetical protein FJ091_02110 [Deltaproteobacteria bacterium]|nr:hypothetical protein [Deltaproteobacteria bacterium]